MVIYPYSFERSEPPGYSQHRYQRIGQFLCDAHTLLDVLQQTPERPIPLIAPIPDKTINLFFAEPLTAPTLERLAWQGYVCKDRPPEKKYKLAA